MLFNLALFSSLLAGPVVLAFQPEVGTRIARRGEGIWSQVNGHLDQPEDASTVSNTEHSQNWAGAIWAKGNETFNYVTGTFTVPTPSGEDGAGASIWVGIDGDTCQSAILQTGIIVSVEGGEPAYMAWYEWIPDYAHPFENISISAGDVVTLSVVAWSANSGMATIENQSNGQFVSQSLNSSAPLCGRDAEWIVEDFKNNNSIVPFADFGTVTFTNAKADGPGGSYTPDGATLYDIQQNGTVLTMVSNDGASVTVQYV